MRPDGRPPLVYLHGLLDGDARPPVLERLGRRFEVIAPVHPGFAGAAELPDVAGFDDLVDFYAGLLDMVGADRVALVGVCLGGWLAAALALRCPHRVSRLVLVSPLGLPPAGAAPPDVFAMDAPTVRATLGLPPRDPGGRAAQEAYHRERETWARLAWDPYLHDPRLAARLHRLTTPTLLLWARQDRLLPSGHLEAWRAALPADARVVGLASGHRPDFEAPEALAVLITPFLAGEE
jgi:pimeloyl-ACP methyl ester carboxylesterase